jgi:thiol-disulfide isomerase/thioredoxin
MQAILKHLLQIRGIKLTLEIILITLVFFTVKAYMQRDLPTGMAPPFEGTLIGGQTVSLQMYRGHPLLLHFWATWCTVCKLEENTIATMSKDYQVVTVAMNSGSELEIEQYLQKEKRIFPVIVDQKGVLAARFGVRGVPTSFVIDPTGKIAFTDVGYTTNWGLRFRLWMAQN